MKKSINYDNRASIIDLGDYFSIALTNFGVEWLASTLEVL